MDAQKAREIVLTALLEQLVEKLTSVVVDFFDGKESILKLLKELKNTLFSADLLLIDAEEKLIMDQEVKKWLDDLKDMIYAADDLVYKIDTEALRKKLEGESQSSCTCKVLTNLIPTPLTAFDKAIKPEIKEVIGKFKALLENKDLGLKLIKKQTLPERVLAPLVEKSDVYGRNVDKEAVLKLLFSDDDKLCVISIVGMGGIGKTTLAQLVCDDERVQEWFDTRAWVTVGDGRVDCLKVMKTIIKKFTDSEKCEIEELHDLQSKLKETLKGKRFFFVIDDIWDVDPQKWEVLKSSFKSGSSGSKILVTTRSKVVASTMKTKHIHQLDPISQDHAWRLFSEHALINENSVEYSYLQETGRKIVDKCNGLPLAIKSLGGLLHDNRNVEDWNKIQDTDMWELYEERRIGIFPTLWLSYYYLPSHLKACFAYCAIFPKDYKFVKEDVILLWMAEGLLHPKNGKRIEEVGEKYFQDLISRSFFQPASEEESTFFMHNLLHDLAIFVSGEFSLDMDDAKFYSCVSKIRNFSYKGGVDDLAKFDGLSKAKRLRTFLTMPESTWNPELYTEEERLREGLLQEERLLKSLQRTNSCLRVLSLSKCGITKLPTSIGGLKYLKYLNLSNTLIRNIPDTICNLYNLQTLLLDRCENVKRLPRNIGNLINLRHLSIPDSLEEMPVQIGKIKNLQSLNNFIISENGEPGIWILKQLHLHGFLRICGLQGVAKAEDAWNAELRNKKFLSKLDLDFGGSLMAEDVEKDRKVLDALKPHANLKILGIMCYAGKGFPDWVGDHLYSCLVKVRLSNCKNCSSLPPLGQLSAVKELVIDKCGRVEKISSEFYSGKKPFRSLETLEFNDFPNLKEWSFMEGEVEGGIFPSLKKLVLKDCFKLKVSLPVYFPSLRDLSISGCEQLLPLVPNGGQQMDTAFPSVEILEITRCSEQDSLLKEGLPSSLKQIRIEDCDKLKRLDEKAFQGLSSLQTLQIMSCNALRCLPKKLPASLSHLKIYDCDFLERQINEETGEDWPIIAHIPTLEVGSHSNVD